MEKYFIYNYSNLTTYIKKFNSISSARHWVI